MTLATFVFSEVQESKARAVAFISYFGVPRGISYLIISDTILLLFHHILVIFVKLLLKPETLMKLEFYH